MIHHLFSKNTDEKKLKSDVHKLDMDEFKNIPSGLDKLKNVSSEVDQLHIDKLKILSSSLSSLKPKVD